MRAVLRCDLHDAGPWNASLLETRIAGLPLLTRHLLGFQRAGISEVELVANAEEASVRQILKRECLPELRVVLRREPAPADGPTIVQRADTLIDPKLLRQLISRSGANVAGCRLDRSLICLDRYSDNYPLSAKSPYRVGVPDADEVREFSDGEERRNGFRPIGVRLDAGQGIHPAAAVDVGRLYWHRIHSPEDAATATRKVLLATIKATDGLYAKLNRRVSLRISRWLVGTPISANAVTLLTLVFSLMAAGLYSVGTYFYMVAGAFMAWFASMMDGVDGELARSRFEESDFGCWLEMICDHLFFVFLFPGIGWGLYRGDGNPLWLWLGVGAAAGTLISFAMIARQRKQYSQKDNASDFGLAFHRSVMAQKSRFSTIVKNIKFLANRAASPYYFFLLTVLGLTKLLLVLIFVGTVVTPTLFPFAARFMRSGDAAEGGRHTG